MSELVRILALTLLHFLWQGALIGAVAAAALRSGRWRTGRERYAICLAALLACALAPLATFVVLLGGEAPPAGPAALPHSPTPALPLPSLVEPGHAASGFDLMWATVTLWLLGMLAVAGWYTLEWRGVVRVRASAVPLDASQPLARAAAAVLRRWGARVPVMLSELVTTPVVIGLWRPIVVFPAATVARMPVEQFELILLHEIAHIVRRDTWANALQVCLEIVLFYHPVVHWLSRRTRLERECACDDFVVAATGSAYRYARALAALALPPERPAALSLAAGGDLLPRLRHLAGECVDHEVAPRLPAHLVLLAALLAALWTQSRLGAPWESVAPPLDPPPALMLPVTRAIPASRSSEPVPAPATQTGVSDRLAHEPAAPRRASPERAGDDAPPSTTAGESAVPDETAASAAADLPLDPVSVTASRLELPPPDEAPQAEPRLLPIHAPLPEYPTRARLDGIEGTVSVALRIGPDGRPRGLRILEAEPVGVFESAVRRAVMQWRYEMMDGESTSGELTASYLLRFSLSGVTSTEIPACVAPTASRTCAPG